MIRLHVWWINVLQRYIDRKNVTIIFTEPDYEGYEFVRYDTADGAPLYNYHGQASDKKWLDWALGKACPPGNGTYDGMQINGWRWSARSGKWWRG